MPLFPTTEKLLDGLGARYPLRARFIRPVVTGRGSTVDSDDLLDNDSNYDDVPCAITYGTGRIGERAGPALTQSRTQGILVCSRKLPKVRETDQVAITDPDLPMNDPERTIRFRIRNAGFRMRLALSGFSLERI